MSISTTQFTRQTTLRREAETRLTRGSAPLTHGWVPGRDAISLLYNLASNPATAGDALKLLHELQVHQVELDLQHEQIEQNRNELAKELAHYVELYEAAPVGYFIVDLEGIIVESNRIGASLIGAKCTELSGRRVNDFLTPASKPLLLALLKRLRIGHSEVCELQTHTDESPTRCLQVIASVSPSSSNFLLVFMDNSTTNRGEINHCS
jgi:PAS domain S-box-containing protein